MKKIIQIILLLLFSSLLLTCFSCSTKNKSVIKEHILYKSDTIFIRDSISFIKEKIILLPTVNSEVISNPCDSLGNLKTIEKVIPIPYGKVEIRSEGNNLVAKVNTDSISSVYEKQYHNRNEKQLRQISELQKEIEKLKITPFNWWRVIGIISLVVNAVLIFIILINKLKL